MTRRPPPPDGSSLVEPGQVTALLAALAAAPAGREGSWREEPLPGDQVDRFRLLRRIGKGGFGVVFEARDEVLGRLVALKLVRSVHRVTPASERLFMEAEAAARLSHPNIVTLFDVGRCDRGPYLVLELLRGESLAARLDRGSVQLPEAVRIGCEVAKALAHAHRHAVVHRDLKPGNVFLGEDGQVKVLDFGMAHAFGLPRVDGGTPAYMAPEQRSGAPEDERTDVYALGVTLYQLLTGKLPHGDDGRQHARLPTARLAIPEAPALSDLVHRMLERDPVRRPRDGAEAVDALEGVSSSLKVAPVRPARPVKRRRRWPVAVAVACAGIAATLVMHRVWPTTPPAATGRLVLAVADIANETGEKELELSGLLRIVLEQSTYLEVLPRGRLVDALPKTQAEGLVHLDETVALAAARAVHARFVLVARLMKLGETYLMEVRAIEQASGLSHFSFKEQVLGKDLLSGLVDRVGERARLLFGEDPAAIRTSTIPAGMVTASLSAWQAYSGGMACLERGYFAGSFGACLVDLERAVGIDSGFGLAYLQLAVLRFLEGEPLALQKAALGKARANLDRVPPHNRQRLEGQVALLDGNEVKAKQLFRASAEASPDDKFAWWLAAEIPFHRDEYAEALPLFRRIHELDPTWLDATQHLTFALGVTGDLDGVRALVSELDTPGQGARAQAATCYARLWIDPSNAVTTCQRARRVEASETTDGFLAIALLNADRPGDLGLHLDAMQRARRGMVRGFAWYMRLWLLAQEGRWSEVEQVAAAERDPADAWFHSTYAEVIAGAGDPGLVRREALRLLELNRSLASNLAVHLAYLGDLRGAADLERYLPPDSPRVEAYRALVRWRSGDLAGAIEPLRRVAAKAPAGTTPEIPPPLYLLGEALSEAGHDAEAVDALRKYQRIPVLVPTWFRPLSSWFLARSLDRLGDRDGARQALAPLLKLWRQANGNQPHLAEALALGKRLGIE